MTHPLKLISPDEALRVVLQTSQPAPPRSVPLLQAVGLRLAEDVRADRDCPPFDRAMMDGYAVRLADAGATLQPAGSIAAGQAATGRLTPGTCFEIMTGAACPEGTQAVVPKELVVREGGFVTLPRELGELQHVAARGAECREGAVVLRAGDVITPLAVGVLASVGRQAVLAVPAPRLGILTTGGELIAGGQSPGSAQIRDSNGPMLAAMAMRCGTPPVQVLHAGDDLEAIVAALEALQDCDLVVLTGGVSAGRYDLVPDSFRRIGAALLFHKVTQKPGKPLLFARRDRQLLFGLPGNPLAAHWCFHRYVAAAIRRRCGHAAAAPERRVGRLTATVRRSDSRTWFLLGRAERTGGAEQEWQVQPLPGGSSADIFSTSQANCYLEVPPGDPLRAAGQAVAFELLALERCAL
ncbi:MAG: molybdopterin molybdotransferase MoeA [Candidatus Anammoximicrobium sp.]|nr:molybdopterin molybdotransferase MoeA [Candidatus Anammoximicrobium sp.]